MGDAVVVLEHSVEMDVSLTFAWRFRTDVANWVDPPATFVLDGPFAAGAQGTTLAPGQEPRHWRVGEVVPERSFVVDVPLDRAIVSFEWRFEALAERRTRLSQRIVLSGPNAAAYREQTEVGFGATLALGMEKIASDLVAAERDAGSTGRGISRGEA